MVFNKKIYGFDWRTLLRWLTPVALRQDKLNALIQAFISPLIYVHSRFINFKMATEYDLSITPQVCFLEKMLNDKFDYTQRRITITPGVYFPPLPLYTEAEAKPVVLYKEAEGNPQRLYREEETQNFASDFLINLPTNLVYDANYLAAVVYDKCLSNMKFTTSYF